MKSNYYIALMLVFAGTHLLTYATTRYLTTKHVLTSAQEKMNATLKNDGLYGRAYPSGPPNHVTMALHSVGGRYYWWNDALGYFGTGGVLIIFGYVAARCDTKKNDG